MKKISILFLNLVTIFAAATLSPSFAQEYYAAAPGHGKGYWEVHTDYRTKNTVVDFYDADRKPLYQEVLSKKYVKLNRKNIRLFDNLLEQLISKKLLSTAVKSYDLTADSRMDFSTISKPFSSGVQATYRTFAQNIYVSERGKLKVILKNPT